MLDINLPHVMAEVKAAWQRYESALERGDVHTLDELFWDSPYALRYGLGENLYGHAQIAAFRAAAAGAPPPGKVHERTMLTTFGQDMATVNTLYRRPAAPGYIGRQSQCWIRTPTGWRIACAHVSVIEIKPEGPMP